MKKTILVTFLAVPFLFQVQSSHAASAKKLCQPHMEGIKLELVEDLEDRISEGLLKTTKDLFEREGIEILEEDISIKPPLVTIGARIFQTGYEISDFDFEYRKYLRLQKGKIRVEANGTNYKFNYKFEGPKDRRIVSSNKRIKRDSLGTVTGYSCHFGMRRNVRVLVRNGKTVLGSFLVERSWKRREFTLDGN